MAEIMEVFEDFGDNAKSLFKNKKFWLIAGGVGIAALIAGYLKNNEDTGEAVAYEAVGYAGYPTVGGASSSNDGSNMEYFEQLLEEVSAGYDKMIGEMQTGYDTTLNEMESNLNTLSDKLVSSEETAAKLQYEIERQNAISQMRANSELYAVLSTPADASTREALHAENALIADKYGFTFDKSSGNWYDGNSVLYITAAQQAAVVKNNTTQQTETTKPVSNSQSGTKPSTTVQYVNNATHQETKNKYAGTSVENVEVKTTTQQTIKDQMAANSKAWHTASDTEKKQLEEANKQLASQLGGLTFDSGSGTWNGTAKIK